MCSTIIIGDPSCRFLAVNYDINITHGLIATNLRGTLKENARQQHEKAIRWQVEYGSITFNQSSLELPAFGMNEKGLVVALMWHDEGDFGESDKFIRMNPLQWIQYQLDICQSVHDVIERLKSVRPRKEILPLHFMFLDKNNDSLIVEFINGEAVCHLNPDYPILTNSSYPRSLELAKSGNCYNATDGGSSLARFNHLFNKYINDRQDVTRILTEFEYLDEVSQTPGGKQEFPWNSRNQHDTVTAWSIHFCPTQGRILFKTEKNKSIREINLAKLEFDASAEYTLMDIDSGEAGNVNDLFLPYTKKHNSHIVRQTGRAFSISDAIQDDLINLVDNMYRNRRLKLF